MFDSDTSQRHTGGMDAKDRDALEGQSRIAPHEELPEFYSGRERHDEFVSDLFDRTARYYDGISAALSFGTGLGYRKMALRRAGLNRGMRMLDVATGTGLAAKAALDLGLEPAAIVGVDPSRGMLQQNQKRHTVFLVQGRGEALPFAGSSFDFICMGYALRHVEDLGILFREFHRVLRPDGRVLILEINRPESRLLFELIRFYLDRFLPAAAHLFTRNSDASKLLRFYWATIDRCVPPETILAALESSGFTNVARRRTGSLLSDYLAMKPVESTAH
jgi:demethylmenaquinone methyltransferase/2-methoxy-6-polyprenyl-1,4-benzoquinol methylase